MNKRAIMFTVYGEPKGKQRPVFTRKGRAYTAKQTVDYEAAVQAAYRSQYGNYSFPLEVTLSLQIAAFYKIPKSTSKAMRKRMHSQEIRPRKTPDIDNVVKIVADALNGVAYADDRQIVTMQASKFYGETPRIEVCLQAI